MFAIRKLYYNLIERFADTKQIKNFTGFGLYDRKFIDILRKLNEPYPYFRGLITEMGFERAEIEFTQPKRKKGKTKNNFYTLYDMAMLGFVNHSKVPLRMATFIGFSVAILSLMIAFGYFVYKLIFWQRFELGMAPMVIGIFFFAAVYRVMKQEQLMKNRQRKPRAPQEKPEVKSLTLPFTRKLALPTIVTFECEAVTHQL